MDKATRARLNAAFPATRAPKPSVNVFKYVHWHETRCGEWQPGVGNPVIGEADRRGQWFSDADQPHSVWVIPLERAPWEGPGRPAPVQLYSHGDGRFSMDWSAARWDRRRANRHAKDVKAAAGRAA